MRLSVSLKSRMFLGRPWADDLDGNTLPPEGVAAPGC